jgi:flagellum-specific ATP synthase
VLKSVSRVIDDITTPEHRRAVARVRDLMSTYAEAADLIKIGAYVRGSDPRVDAAIAAAPRIEAMVRQGLDEGATREHALHVLHTLV